jgi:RNA polymerase sigma-70 factor (ECF subfamily)
MFLINSENLNIKQAEKNLITDEELVRKICQGDPSSFEKFFHRYCQVLIDFGRRYVNDTQIAENIVQNVFLKIWEFKEKLDPSANIKTYLYTSVKNQALNYLRHLNVENQYAENVDILTAPTPEDNKFQKEIKESVYKAIAQLPKKTRIIFLMNRFDNLTYKEIAKIQNISIKTVETQMGRALKFLRNHLSHLLSIFPL